MADVDKGIPVRTEDDADQKIQSKIVDHTTPAQGAEVDTDGNLHVEAHGNDPGGTDRVLRLSELGAPNPDGDYDASNNSKPASSGLVAHDRNAAPDETHQNKRITGVAGADNTVCLDVAIRDEAGAAFSGTNPLPVTFEQSEGTEIHDFNEAVDVAADGGTATHTYSVADGNTLQLMQVLADASSRFKITLEIGDGAVSEAFTKKAIRFKKESGDKGDIVFATPIIVTGTVNTTTVKVTVQNDDDDDAQSIYTTIVGVES